MQPTTQPNTKSPNEFGSPEKDQVSPERPGSQRDPEERHVDTEDDIRQKMLDKTLADSFPTSDPPSTIPDPGSDDSYSA